MIRAERGFSLLELLIALTICALAAASLATLLPPSRAAFEYAPTALEIEQRLRTAIEVMTRAVRGAGIDGTSGVSLFDDSGTPAGFARMTTVAVRRHAGQGVLAEEPGSGGAHVLSAAGCPAAAGVCGFVPGARVAIGHGISGFELFTVSAVDAAQHSIASAGALAGAYPAGAQLIEVEAVTFRLAVQTDGSRSLVRETHAGAVQPIIDHVLALGFQPDADPDGALRGIEVTVVVQAAPGATRLPLRARAQQWRVRVRNAW